MPAFLIIGGGLSASFIFAAGAGDIIINEIAWMGTTASYNDERIVVAK